MDIINRRKALTVVAAMPAAAALAAVVPALAGEAPEEKVVPPFPTLLARILPDEELMVGCVVAYHFLPRRPSRLLLGVWEGPTGRDGNGRFVPAGSKDECNRLSFFTYTQSDIDNGLVTIVGVVDYHGVELPSTEGNQL